MKLRNKKTGAIGKIGTVADFQGTIVVVSEDDEHFIAEFDSLDKLNEYWEDYAPTISYTLFDKKITLYFETEEEAEKAVEKLKAWKRLKDKGFERVFKLELGNALCGGKTAEFKLLIDDEDLVKDIELLFGGEE